MSNTPVSPVTRRRLPAAAPAVAKESNGSDTNSQVEEEAAPAVEQVPLPQLEGVEVWDVSPATDTNDVDKLVHFRNDIDEHSQMLDAMVRSNWELPMSKETVYALGKMEGKYAMLLAQIDHDIADARAQE